MATLGMRRKKKQVKETGSERKPERLGSLRWLKSLIVDPVNPDDVDGFDPRMVSAIRPFAETMARHYLRMEIKGWENIPDGPALMVGNHNAGITFLETFGLFSRWYDHRPDDILHWLVHDAMLAMPGLRTFLSRGGCVRASHKTADMALDLGRKVAVFPGGNLEAFRPYKDRYKIVFGGHKGFVRLAYRHGVPIVPIVIVGGHESFFVLHDGRRVAKMLGIKRFLRSDTCPIFVGLPWGIGVGPIFHLHLPTKSHIRILPPIQVKDFGNGEDGDEAAIDAIYEAVTSSMQAIMDEVAADRRFPVLG
ncbi:MAG: acyltransferase family protein [Deltaproteobacteria bacterium]|nr:acyltransferase family protein [Deltaproteobacteria bacterium]